MELDDVKKIIQEFAETHHILQQKDIHAVESSTVFNRKEYLKLDNKPFVRFDEYKHSNRTEIVFGRIYIMMDDIDEEEVIWINDDRSFLFLLTDFTDQESLKSLITTECIKHQLIPNIKPIN